MKLQNKKTGEIVEIDMWAKSDLLEPHRVETVYGEPITLAELNKEWEDYEEPKGFWAIENGHGQIIYHKDSEGFDDYKEIGNYFGTKEEAERTVEKLKARKRLKDKGFKFNEYLFDGKDGGMAFFDFWYKARNEQTKKDFDLLFGGEDDR